MKKAHSMTTISEIAPTLKKSSNNREAFFNRIQGALEGAETLLSIPSNKRFDPNNDVETSLKRLDTIRDAFQRAARGQTNFTAEESLELLDSESFWEALETVAKKYARCLQEGQRLNNNQSFISEEELKPAETLKAIIKDAEDEFNDPEDLGHIELLLQTHHTAGKLPDEVLAVPEVARSLAIRSGLKSLCESGILDELNNAIKDQRDPNAADNKKIILNFIGQMNSTFPKMPSYERHKENGSIYTNSFLNTLQQVVNGMADYISPNLLRRVNQDINTILAPEEKLTHAHDNSGKYTMNRQALSHNTAHLTI